MSEIGNQKKKSEQKEKKFRFSFVDFIIPALSGLIFVLILFFVLLPSINNSNETLRKIEEIRKQQETLKRNLNSAKSIDFVRLQSDLSNAREVLPYKLEVAQFAYYIDNLAMQKKLNFKELKASDIAISKEEISILDVKGIRVPMGYSGDYEPILDFFNELQLASPYIISFGHKVSLNKSGTQKDTGSAVYWSLEIDVTGYYADENTQTTKTINLLNPVVPYDSNQEMLLEFTERVKKLAN